MNSRSILTLSIALNSVLILGAVGFIGIKFYEQSNAKQPIVASSASSLTYSSYTHRLRSSILSEKPNSHAIVMFGDSITGNAEWSEWLQSDVANRACAGDKVDGLMDRLEEVVSCNPSKVFLMIGINDLTSGDSEANVAKKIKSLTTRLHEKLPHAKIFLQSIIETNPQSSLLNPEQDAPRFQAALNQKVKNVNSKLSSFANEYITYVDLNSKLSNESGLKAEYTADGIHLNGKGYAAWVKALDQILSGL